MGIEPTKRRFDGVSPVLKTGTVTRSAFTPEKFTVLVQATGQDALQQRILVFGLYDSQIDQCAALLNARAFVFRPQRPLEFPVA